MEGFSAARYQSIVAGDDAASIARDIRRHIVSSLGADYHRAGPLRVYKALALAVRDRLIDDWIRTQRSTYDEQSKRVYYLSMEFLPGRFLVNSLLNLGLVEAARAALAEFGFTLEELEAQEWDAGLGNGGLGRLASCYLSSAATLRLPFYGYGIRYDYGIFYQLIQDGAQVERPDNWLRLGNPWEFDRPEHLYEVKFGGRTESRHDVEGRLRVDWVDAANVMAMACDTLVPGYRNGNALNMRLWSARSSREFELADFNAGDYVGAIQNKLSSENLSKVLYPSESVRVGRELRLRQEYFFVSATFQDIFRRFRKKGRPLERLADFVAVQLNDTHPAVAVAELMRLLVDVEGLPWEKAWGLTVATCGYTNPTVMPEALETWPVEMFEKLLPRHTEIVYEINRRFLDEVRLLVPGDEEKVRRVSLFHEDGERRLRMANLAVVGSHAVNGVSALHSRIVRDQVFRDFAELFPGRFSNKTNGIDHRRFLLQANPALAELISGAIGDSWITDLDALRGLEPFAGDAGFRQAWRDVKAANKRRLAGFLAAAHGFAVDPDTLLDIQVKRIHEYKRQLLNVLHVVTLYNRIKAGGDAVPRTVLIGGKAAPSYATAKLVIRLVNAVAEVINADPATSSRLRLYFVPNYCVTLAERLAPAADVSEQISTAGMEASGTGNMKFALNGALLVGTLDGANIEIRDAIGVDNIFIFGKTAEEVRALRASGYDPRAVARGDGELVRALEMIADGTFSPAEPGRFRPLVDALLDHGDHFLTLADYRSFVDCQGEVDRAYRDVESWTRRSILSVARMGFFSADRSVREYARDIWGVVAVGGLG